MEGETYFLPLTGEITWEMAELATREILQECLGNKVSRIVVPIATQGGDPESAWNIYSSLKHCGVEVITVANGRVYSAGIIIYLAGDRRYVYDDSLFLFHPTEISINRDEDRNRYKVAEDLQGLILDEEYFINLLKTTLTKTSKRDIKRLTHKTKSAFIGAEEAVRIGLADWIINNINQIQITEDVS